MAAIPKHNPDEMHLTLMGADFGCQDSNDIVDALIECIQDNQYQADPIYLMQCLNELHLQDVVDRVKAHFGL